MDVMKVRRPAKKPTRLDLIAWSCRALGLACVVPLLSGCQTVSPWAEAKQKSSSAPKTLSLSKNDTPQAPADFATKPTPDQQMKVHLELGRVYEADQQFEAALAEYQKALDMCAQRGLGGGAKGSGTRQALAHRRMGATYDRMGRFAQAEVHYRTALKLSPDDPLVWNDAGYSYYMQSRFADAERSLKTAAKLAPNDNKIQTNLGLALAASGKNDEALAALSKAGGNAVGHANLGFILASLGRTEQARQHYQMAIEIQPKLAVARQALANIDHKPYRRVEQIAAIPTPPLPRGTDVNVRRTAAPRVAPTASVYSPTTR